jgi:hypothetical protein
MDKLYLQFKALTTQDDFKFYLNSFILKLGLKAMEDIKVNKIEINNNGDNLCLLYSISMKLNLF